MNTKFCWSRKRARAALLIAEGKKSIDEIAKEIAVAPRSLKYWKLCPEFAARVADHIEVYRQAVLKQGIADRVHRVAELSRRWEAMQKVIEERGADPSMQEVPGGTTGLLVRQVKGIGRGEHFREVYEYRLDNELLRELRAYAEQAARELGQWIERSEVMPQGAGALPVAYEEALKRIYGEGPDEAGE
jgi:hypothetical protein